MACESGAKHIVAEAQAVAGQIYVQRAWSLAAEIRSGLAPMQVAWAPAASCGRHMKVATSRQLGAPATPSNVPQPIAALDQCPLTSKKATHASNATLKLLESPIANVSNPIGP